MSNNFVYTSGNTADYGIYLLGVSGGPVNNNIIHNNNISTSGTAATSSNHGVLLATNANYNNITDNTVYASGTTSYGVYLLGTTLPVEENYIARNTILTQGNATNNFGIYLFNRARKNTIVNNSVSTFGTSTNHGVYISGAGGADFDSSENNISYNSIYTTGTAGSNYGVYLYRNANSNYITHNYISTFGTSSNYGVYGVGTTNLPVNNNLISSNYISTSGTTGGLNLGIRFGAFSSNNSILSNDISTYGAGTLNYGIYLVGGTDLPTNNNIVYKNNISTFGTTGNYGIYIATNAHYNNLTDNLIYTNGTGASNYGVYLYRNTDYNIIAKNLISTSGTTTSHGIYLIGTTDLQANNNLIEDNSIYTSGTAASSTNYGIILSSNVNNNEIKSNNITASGTTANYGVYILGTATLTANNNSIYANRIHTIGATNNYGIYLRTNANQNNISYNNISTIGTTGNIGIAITGTTSPSLKNILSGNILRPSGTTGGHGIHITTNSSNNTISRNDILTNGTTTSYGIYLLGATGNPVAENQIYENQIKTSCSSPASSCYGLYLQNLASSNQILSNKIVTSGTANDFGIYLLGTEPLPVGSNIFESNTIETFNADSVRVNTGSINNTFLNNTLINNNSSYYDFNILSESDTGTLFIDQNFSNYNFAGIGEIVKIKKQGYGEIQFTDRITGSGSSFSSKINIGHNYAFVDSQSQPGLNRSAIITLYSLNFEYPAVLRDGEAYTNCHILSNEGGTIRFSVQHFSSYSIGDNARLEIFDDTDFNESFGPVNFYANYTNITSGQPVESASCIINFSASSQAMLFNSSLGIYIYFANLPQGTHYYTVSCSATGYAPLNATDFANIADFKGPVGANITSLKSDRANLSFHPSQQETEGGNITSLVFDAITLTKSWQGYYGKVYGKIMLESPSGKEFYSWEISSPAGEVYAARTPSVNFATVSCADISVIEAEELFIDQNPSDGDSVRNTFNKNTHPGFYVGSIPISENSCNSTNIYINSSAQDSYFYQVLLKDGASNIIYSAIINANLTGFDSQSYDFQMLVGENGRNYTVTPYYFFVQLR